MNLNSVSKMTGDMLIAVETVESSIAREHAVYADLWKW
jgi:hypothetical protein